MRKQINSKKSIWNIFNIMHETVWDLCSMGVSQQKAKCWVKRQKMLSFQRHPRSEQVHLLSLTVRLQHCDVATKRGSKLRRGCEAVLCDPALRAQLRAVGVLLECLFLEILALGTELTAPQGL